MLHKGCGSMSENSGINSFIEAQHALNVTMSNTLGRIEEAQKNTSQRLLGGDGQKGAIPYMNEKLEKVTTRVGKLETWKVGTLKWVAGVVAVLTAEGALLGFYFSHLAARVQSVTDAIKINH